MTRILSASLLLVCSYAIQLPAMDRSAQICADNSSESLDELRQSTYDTWKQKQLAKAADCYHEILTSGQSLPVSPRERANDLDSAGGIFAELGRYRSSRDPIAWFEPLLRRRSVVSVPSSADTISLDNALVNLQTSC